ncbi:glycosyltransferase family 4 protein [Photobacterium carnosum]|uniref:glycosyltransferase family 4 protein n=1 Tax=Photobacterium carnosum TaxID=2023717 RepID=UPI00128C0CE6|nr:glycosyltransferase family 4 protein [Photobacterium carnosum]KAE8177941.1 hypothetical protein CIT27_04160 [Photobacterium carnosum]
MKVLYVGDFIKGNGPSTVDICVRDSIEKSTKRDDVDFLQSTTKPSFSIFKKIFEIDSVHVSGVSFLGMLLIVFARLCGKKSTMTMHGSLVIESQFKKVSLYRRIFEYIQQKLANQIMPVSSLLAEKAKINKKCTVIPNGKNENNINIISTDKNNNLITLIGGGRREKRHLDICEVIQKINNENGFNIQVNLFGEKGVDSNKIKTFDFVKDFGFCDKDTVFYSLARSRIFIQYSEFEPFSLAVADAINYGCYIITSNLVGINEFITESDSYIIVNNKLQLETAIISQYNNRERVIIDNNLLTWEQVTTKYIKCWETL